MVFTMTLNKDVIPVGVTMQEPNAVGEDYSYTDNSESIIEQNQQNIQAQKKQIPRLGDENSQSDWGTYAGTEQNIYYNNYNWGYPYYGMEFRLLSLVHLGGYSPLGMNYYWGCHYLGYVMDITALGIITLITLIMEDIMVITHITMAVIMVTIMAVVTMAKK